MAYNNFKNNMKTYTMFFISMVFSVIILSNFFILMRGDAIKTLGEYNANYTKMIAQMIIVILVIFIFFLFGILQIFSSKIGRRKLDSIFLWGLT